MNQYSICSTGYVDYFDYLLCTEYVLPIYHIACFSSLHRITLTGDTVKGVLRMICGVAQSSF